LIERDKLFPAKVVVYSILAAGAILTLFGCAVRHLPSGATAPATRLEPVLVWTAALAQANDGFADNVIGLQRAGFLGMNEAKAILLRQAAIADADNALLLQLRGASQCAVAAAGPNPSPAALDAAGSSCAQVSAAALKNELNAITAAVADLNNAGVLAVKDPAKRQALTALLLTTAQLVANIVDALTKGGILH